MQLTAKSVIGDWLQDPVGAQVLGAALSAGGSDATALAPMSGVSLEALIPMSQGLLTAQMVEGLVQQVREINGEPSAPLMDERGDTAEGQPAAPKAWAERIVPGRFLGQTVIVTGAGSGIGRATASRVAREGGRVIAVDVSQERLTDLVATLPDAHILPVSADITDDAGITSIIDAAGDGIDAVANVAGIMDNMTPVHEVGDEIWNRVLDINLTGMMKLMRAAIPTMLQRGAGSIVNVASEAALRGSQAGAAYTTSKHAVLGLTRSSAFMYGPSGLRINAVAPGGVATNIQARFDSALGAGRVTPLIPFTPPLATPEMIAASITFLLSEDGVNVNGAVLPSDGGLSAQ